MSALVMSSSGRNSSYGFGQGGWQQGSSKREGKSSSRREGKSSSLRSLSTRRLTASFAASRSLRARQRRAFLKAYRLSSLDDQIQSENSTSRPPPRSNKCQKLKQAAVKVKSAIVSVVAAARFSSLQGRCNPRWVTWPRSPFSFHKH
ncbi:hypothetical protein Dimus_019808 [Dionaea muscipula]